MQKIQLTKEQETELQNMTRPVTPDEQAALNQAYVELENKGFVINGENILVLLRAYQAAPQAKITTQGVLDFTAKFRDAFQWLSAAELEYNTLSAQLGPAMTGVVTKELGRHGLENTAGTEALFTNFSSIVRYYQSQGWQISADNFALAVGNLRSSLNHGALIYRPTPSQLAQQKRWENTRNSESKKSLLEIAKEKAANVHHVFNSDGTRMSDTIMREFFERHPEFLETETETPAQTTPPVNPDDGYWKRRVHSFINSIQSHVLRGEAEEKFGKQAMNGTWHVNFVSLENFISNRKAEKPGLWV